LLRICGAILRQAPPCKNSHLAPLPLPGYEIRSSDFALEGKIMNFRGILVSALVLFSASVANATIQTIQYKNSVDTLTFEILNDQLLHFEYSPLASAPSTTLKTTPFIYKVDYVGPSGFNPSNNSFQTQAAHVDIDPTTLCFDVTDLKQNVKLTHICQGSTPNGYELTISKNQTQNIY
jgi:hypothetical protein